MPLPPPLTLTDAAVARVKALMARSDQPILGLRIGVKTAGCSGLTYTITYATDEQPFEEKVDQDGAVVFVDASAVMFLIGSEMDYQVDKLQATFTFNNPNETSRCGCGESFTVDPKVAEKAAT
ncbi:MAG: HesB/IscA family protein [Rhodospirillaceae bacterium]